MVAIILLADINDAVKPQSQQMDTIVIIHTIMVVVENADFKLVINEAILVLNSFPSKIHLHHICFQLCIMPMLLVPQIPT